MFSAHTAVYTSSTSSGPSIDEIKRAMDRFEKRPRGLDTIVMTYEARDNLLAKRQNIGECSGPPTIDRMLGIPVELYSTPFEVWARMRQLVDDGKHVAAFTE